MQKKCPHLPDVCGKITTYFLNEYESWEICRLFTDKKLFEEKLSLALAALEINVSQPQPQPQPDLSQPQPSNGESHYGSEKATLVFDDSSQRNPSGNPSPENHGHLDEFMDETKFSLLGFSILRSPAVVVLKKGQPSFMMTFT